MADVGNCLPAGVTVEDLTSLVQQGRHLLSHALTHSIALPAEQIKILSNADADLLASQQAAREAFIDAFAGVSKAVGMSSADIRSLAARNSRLRPLVDSALLLLNFAAANGKPVDNETRNTLIATEAAVAAGRTTLEQDQAFLKAYEDLTKALAPITVETLEASTTKLPSIIELFRRKGIDRPPIWTLGRFVNASIFIAVLISTGISLAYYSVGATALAKYRDLQASVLTLKQKEVEAIRDLALKDLAMTQAAKAKDKAGSPTAGQLDEAAALNAVLQSRDALVGIQVQQALVSAELRAIPERLGRWAMQPCISRNFIFNAALCAGVDEPDSTVLGKRQAIAAAVRAASSAAPQITPTADILTPSSKSPSRDATEGTLVDVEAARTVVSRMSDVYLPLLLGFLGAHAFILRRMSKEITEKTFAKGSAFNHIVRIGLGALAGLASTWLLTPEAVGGPSLKTLPAWALAFVAGYGIELVFAFMDRIISAFTNPAK